MLKENIKSPTNNFVLDYIESEKQNLIDVGIINIFRIMYL